MERIPTAGVILIDGDKVLLVEHQEGAGHLTGSFGAPGGKVDPGETPIQAAVRETQEETGLLVKEEDLIELPHPYEADLERKNGQILYVTYAVFAGNKFEGELKDSNETIPRWVLISDLANKNLLPNIEDMVERAQEILNT